MEEDLIWLKEGQCYWTRDGQVTGPLWRVVGNHEYAEKYPFRCWMDGCKRAFTASGRYESDYVTSLDLVREYVKPSMAECFGDLED